MTSWIHKGGFDNVLFTPNGKVHALLTRLAFENLLHPFQPFIIGQKNIAPKMALMYKIPLIFYGENQAEYGNKIEENDKPTMSDEFFAHDVNLNNLFLGGVSAKELIDKHKISSSDLNPYLPAKRVEIKKQKVQVHYLSYYIRWDPQECYYYASENTGFVPNSERTEGSYSKYSSIDDKIDPFHYYTTLIKFGIGQQHMMLVRKFEIIKLPERKALLSCIDLIRNSPENTSESFWNILIFLKRTFGI